MHIPVKIWVVFSRFLPVFQMGSHINDTGVVGEWRKPMLHDLDDVQKLTGALVDDLVW